MKKVGFAFVFFLLATVVLTWPLSLHMGSQIAGEGADALLNLWIHLWDFHVLTHGNLLRLFDANIFFPAPKSLALSEHCLSNLLIFGPVYAITGNPVLAYNVLFLGSLLLSGLAACALGYRLTGQFGPSLVAGFVFAFIPIRFAHLGHIQLQTVFWSPLAFLFLDRYLEKRDWTSLIVFSICTAMQSWASFYSGYFLILLLGLYYVLFHVGKRTKPSTRDAVGLALILVLVVPLAYPYLSLKSYFGFVRDLGEVRLYSADLGSSFFTIPPTNWLYARWLPSGDNCERMLFVGFVPLILSLFAIGRWFRSKRALILTLTGTLLGSVIVALGPVLTWFGGEKFSPLPYRFFYEFVPGFSSMRVPTRVLLISALVIALLAALALVARGPVNRRGHVILVSVVLVVLFLEYRNTPLALAPIPQADEIPTVYKWLSKQPTDGGVLELPAGGPYQESWYEYYSAFHFQPLVNGYSGYFPGYSRFLRAELARPLSRETIEILKTAGISKVILHRNHCDPSDWDRAVSSGWAREIGRFGDDQVLAPTVSPSAGKLKIRQLALDFASPATTIDASLILEAEGGVWRNDLKQGMREVDLVWTEGTNVYRKRSRILLPVAIAGQRAVAFPITTPDAPGLYQLEIRFGDMTHNHKVRITPWRSDIYNGESFLLSRRPVILSTLNREEFVNYCVDGNLRTSWTTWETQSPYMFLRADLLARVKSRGVGLFLGPEITNYPRHLAIATSLDGTNWEPVAQSSYGIQFADRQYQENDSLLDNVLTVFWEPREFRFIRLQLNTIQPNFWWSVAEIEILGTAGPQEKTSLDSGELGGELELRDLVPDGEKFRADVRIRNKGPFIWLKATPSGVGSVRLAARWYTARGEEPDSERFWLPRPLLPGEETTMQVTVTPPPQKGRYRLRFDLVDEGIAWLPNGVERELAW